MQKQDVHPQTTTLAGQAREERRWHSLNQTIQLHRVYCMAYGQVEVRGQG